MALDFPSSPSVGTQYVSPTGPLYIFDNNSSWSSIGDTQAVNPYADCFKYRTIITHGYVLGGYKDSSPWKNVNRTVHATDITTNLGDKLDYGAAYANGSYSDYNAYVYGVDDVWPGSSTYTTSMSMSTENGRTHSTIWDLKSSRSDCGCMLNSTNTICYITADDVSGQSTDKHNYVTDTMYAAGTVGNSGVTGTTYGNSASWSGQFKGWVQAAACANFTFSTETYSAGGTTVGTDGWGKALSSKHGYAYVKNGGNCVTSSYKLNDTSGAQIRTDLVFDYSGEENYEMGQNWGYCLGHYNGVQNCNSYRVNYLTDAYTVLGSDTQPKGHAGMSSGACASASANIVGTIF